MFPPNDDYNAALTDQCQKKGIEQFFKHNLTSIDKDNRIATFKNGANGEIVEKEFDFLHFVPP